MDHAGKPWLKVLAAAAAPLVAAACATAPPPAVLTYGGAGCTPAPDLGKAISLVPKRPRPAYAVVTALDATAPCLTRAGGPSPYRLYALPGGLETKTLTAGAVLEQARLFAPDIAVLDSQGKVTRTFSTPDYLFRGAVYSVEFRPRPADAYLLVAADPTRVGQRYDSIAIGTSTTSTYANGMALSWTSGVDAKLSRTFSYAGSVEVTVFDSAATAKR